MKKILICAVFLLSAGLLLATPTDTPTETMTATITETITATMTSSITDTATCTFTETLTSTITPTYTITPTPQGKAFAFPNPAKNTNEMRFAYPLEADKTATLATVIIKAINGEEAGRAFDRTPNGYTVVDISKYARGVYMYQLTVEYSDGTKKVHPLGKFGKFAVIK